MVKRHVMTRYIICLLTSVNFTKTMFFNQKKYYLHTLPKYIMSCSVGLLNFLILSSSLMLIKSMLQIDSIQGRQTGGGWLGGSQPPPPEFWMGGGVEHLSTPPLILRRFLFGGGGGLAPLKLI